MNWKDNVVYWHKIERDRAQDGPGLRTVLWLVGCPIRCKGCQSHHLWDRDYPGTNQMHPALLARKLYEMSAGQPLTITGGEPFAQVEMLASLLYSVRQIDEYHQRPRREILVFTGFTWQNLISRAGSDPMHPVHLALQEIDVLVDRPYDPSQDDNAIQWRGSRNQRVIDVQASRANGALAFEERLILLDWDTPTLTLTPDGALVGAGDLVRELFGEGEAIGRCGH
jgi:anaerobic ribonucleoside-triphosphate reductase activating protein